MNTILSLVAIVCVVAVLYRTIDLVNRMDWRTRSLPYPKFLAFGLSHIGLCVLTVGCALVILDKRADLWSYLLVYSVGGVTIFDRRKQQ